jgi:hypothetical protein
MTAVLRTQTRKSILRLLLAGARHLGNVVSAHMSYLLTELAELRPVVVWLRRRKRRSSTMMADLFTKESVLWC